MDLRTIEALGDLHGKRVLVRADFNVPIARSRILDDTRIVRTLPTIHALQRAGATCVLVSHLGKNPRATLAPVAARLGELLDGVRVTFLRERIGTAALRRALEALPSGAVALLENVRRYAGETTNDRAFATTLAALADAYVDDAFGVSHRKHASLVAVTKHLPSAAGLLMAEEVRAMERVVSAPKRPFVALIGGVKIETKVAVLERLMSHADAVLLGGALVHPFLVARGYDVGGSIIEEEGVALAKRIMKNRKRKNLTFPLDVLVGDSSGKRQTVRVVRIGAKPHAICDATEAILDIGPETIRAYAQQIAWAQTLLWNGPMGKFEQPPFHHGSVMLARKVASRSSGRAYGIVGGGETLAVLGATKMAKYVDHVCTGGGAMLTYLAGEPMPAIDALRAV